MQRQDFFYSLPNELIARKPTPNRTGSRLLCLNGDTGSLEHKRFPELIEKLEAGDVMVFNNTRVIPARVYGHKESGGKLEILVERVVDAQHVLAHVRASKSPKPGSIIVLQDGTRVTMASRAGALFELVFEQRVSAFDVLDAIGHMPLPPYIDRPDDDEDKERYQTVYAKEKGAVAAPTAGLHFDEPMLAAIKAKGVDIVFVTLHVGAGTFQPVRVDDIATHDMHSEVMIVDQHVCDRVKHAQANKKRVIAVGTTSVRCLETASQSGEIMPFEGDTDIFIYPGYRYRCVDALITNFHLPESTLVMLVSAFAGYKHTLHAYAQAVENQYRFFSYGDAMFITRNEQVTDDVPG